MSENFDLRSRSYLQSLVWGLIAGLISALGAFVFLGLMNFGLALVWPNPPGWEPFSGSWTIVVIMTAAGFLVGLIHRFTPAAELDVFEAVDKGRLDPKPVPSSLLASLISLIGGFSLGPEVPSGMLAAGFGTWLSERRVMDPETTRTNVLASVSAAYSGLFSSPLALIVMLLESSHVQNIAYYGPLFISGLAAAIGFSLFFFLGGETFSPLLGLVQPPEYDLHVWDVGMGVVFGILAIPVAVIFGLLYKLISTLVAPLNSRPIIRGTLGGLLLGLLGMALPITLFLGTEGLAETTSQAAEIGFGLLILFALAKMLALSGALSFGFIGGPIFPMLFVGATLGSAVNLLFPQIPLGLAVGCLMAAVPAAIVPIPVALAIIVIVVVGLSPMNTIPVILASLTSFAVARGLGLFAGSAENKQD
ncbi:MAG: chloride channel protein [Candidatus Promineifilaceae bacterium]|nr:chloride channel protein [Candidatus Promineifilaceae bacterium]